MLTHNAIAFAFFAIAGCEGAKAEASRSEAERTETVAVPNVPVAPVEALQEVVREVPSASAEDAVEALNPEEQRRFREVIRQVVRMPHNSTLQRRSRRLGLHVLNVMWEDTGRHYGSAVGPNISDLTLQVREKFEASPTQCARSGRCGTRTRTHLLPVLRSPNFADRTADVAADSLWVRVGNQREGEELRAVPLTEVLEHLGEYLSSPEMLLGTGNLLAPRDTHFLVNAQHVFVPVPENQRVEFNPVLYNYQSTPGNPAVLVMLITRHGTSVQVIENRSGDQSYQGWGQQLYFNHHGQKTVFTAERRSEVQARIEAGEARAQDEGALEEGADMMMIVQVPLRYRRPVTYRSAPSASSFSSTNSASSGAGIGAGGLGNGMGGSGSFGDAVASAPSPSISDNAAPPQDDAPSRSLRAESALSGRLGPAPLESDAERAVIGYSEELGPFQETRGRRLVRDHRYPVRVTVQFYKATSNGVISDEDLASAREHIDRVYREADYVGSLVMPAGQRRPTDWHNRELAR